MAEYIDRDKVLDALQGRIKLSDECLPFFKEYLQGVNDRIKAIPSADVVERKRGKWLYTPTHWAYCSVCGKEPPSESNFATKFCSWCGAEMENHDKYLC